MATFLRLNFNPSQARPETTRSAALYSPCLRIGHHRCPVRQLELLKSIIMKTKNQILLTALLLATLNSQLSSAHAQGSLTPPGAPAATMKSLDQIEPRSVINTVGATIAAPGSYYLTTNLLANGAAGVNGITISANDVVLDLNGYSLDGGGITSSSGSGINVSGTTRRLSIRNGTIRNWGNTGINAANSSACTLENLTVQECRNNGITVGVSSLVRNCLVISNQTAGASAIQVAGNGVVEKCVTQLSSAGITIGSNCVVADCIAQGNVTYGINVLQSGCLIKNCSVVNNGFGGIISASYTGSVKVLDCNATGNGYGILLGIQSEICGCFASSNNYCGIYLQESSRAVDNTCYGNNPGNISAYGGLVVGGNNGVVDGNHISANQYAGVLINTGATNNVIVRNEIFGNGGNFSIRGATAQNIVGPLINSTGVITNNNPWANFSF